MRPSSAAQFSCTLIIITTMLQCKKHSHVPLSHKQGKQFSQKRRKISVCIPECKKAFYHNTFYLESCNFVQMLCYKTVENCVLNAYFGCKISMHSAINISLSSPLSCLDSAHGHIRNFRKNGKIHSHCHFADILYIVNLIAFRTLNM